MKLIINKTGDVLGCYEEVLTSKEYIAKLSKDEQSDFKDEGNALYLKNTVDYDPDIHVLEEADKNGKVAEHSVILDAKTVDVVDAELTPELEEALGVNALKYSKGKGAYITEKGLDRIADRKYMAMKKELEKEVLECELGSEKRKNCIKKLDSFKTEATAARKEMLESSGDAKVKNRDKFLKRLKRNEKTK